MAEKNAVAAGIAQYDDFGTLYWECFAKLEWIRQEDVRQSA